MIHTAKRVSLFCGHYGSGKTNIAVNYALALKASGKDVRIADLDIVNPYFRTKDSMDVLTQAGIPLISPAYANSNVDLPALPQELYGLVQQRQSYAVLDIGGDDRGAYALGRFVPYILEEQNYEMFCVVNFYRPLTQTAEDTAAIMREIEAAAHLPFTAIINNSNLGEETSAYDILSTCDECKKLASMVNLPIACTSVQEDLLPSSKREAEHRQMKEINFFPMTLQKKYFDIEPFDR